MKFSRRLIFIFGVLVFMMLGVVNAADQSFSGFLDTYPELSPDADRKGALIYQNPEYDLGTYNKFIIEPVLVWFHPKSKYKGIDPDQLKILADEFRDSLIEELSGTYPVVEQFGPGVAIIRVAITDIRMKKKKRSLLGYTPIGLVVTTAKSIAGKNISMQDAALELELIDSQTGDQVGVIIDRQSLSKPPKNKKKQKTSWSDIQETFSFYAARFKANLDKAREK